MTGASRFLTPKSSLIALTLLFTAEATIATLLVEEVDELTAYLWSLAFGLSLAWWVSSDRIGRAFEAPYEYEALLLMAWPVLLPHYLYRTRGPKGLLQGIGVLGVFMIPYVAAGVAYVVTR